MSHNETLREKVGTSTRACADRIVATYLLASKEQIDEGIQWYPKASDLVDTISKSSGIRRDNVAAMVAQLSPQLHWTRNVWAAKEMAQGRTKMPGVLSRSIHNARVAMKSDNPLGTINGPKTSAFARNILGDVNAVTIDVWAARTALGIFDKKEIALYLGREGVYDALAHAYRIAANRISANVADIFPCELQAIVWIVERGRAE